MNVSLSILTNRAARPLGILAALLLSACAAGPAEKSLSQTEGNIGVADLHVVDCLLPGQVRSLGQSTYLTARRPIHTTAADCRIRGGEYVAYDRADYRTALQVWMAAAEAGDAEAQVNVGEIFERGLGGAANHEAAIIWYRRAAEQGNKRAQFNLGTMYEQGFGVPQDRLQALNWYRQAWGLEEDSVIYQSAAQEAQAGLRAQLQKTLDEKSTQIRLLNNQLAGLQANANRGDSAENAKLKAELSELQNWIQRLEQEQQVAKVEYDSLPRFREPEPGQTQQVVSGAEAKSINIADMKFGKYYALIIANEDYQFIDDLKTPSGDAMRAKELLEKNFGFKARVLINGDNISLMKAINELNETVTEEDNLLIFYAGHGSRITTGDLETGYWLPSNATPPPDDTFWVSNEFVTRHLARIKAKRVMVVADSCYAGLLSSAPGYLFMGENATYNEDYVRYKLPHKSRLLLSSGGDQPVLDNIGQGHSVFARAFLEVLENTDQILSAPDLFLQVREQVATRAKAIGFDQVPEFKVIKGAGHEVGDFFFVRSN